MSSSQRRLVGEAEKEIKGHALNSGRPSVEAVFASVAFSGEIRSSSFLMMECLDDREKNITE